jgi:23S rRNA pseudouridine1911/1915/1917 synthase
MPISPQVFSMEIQPLQILFEDRQLLAVNKPQGIVVEREPHLKYTLESLALNYIRAKEKYPQKCFIGLPHRLDRPVSGVVLFAKKKSILKMLVELFSKRQLDKTYLAMVESRPEKDEDEVVNWLVKDVEKRKAIIHNSEVKDSMRVILRYKFVAENEFGSLLQVKLITGKFHQIRAQLSHIGCPIIGDSHYGSSKVYKENAICLHARSLELIHPGTNEPLKITAETPDDEIWNSFAALIK